MNRKYMDCREAPSVSGCTLRISGGEEEVVRAAAEHEASVHDEPDTPRLREEIRASLGDEDESSIQAPRRDVVQGRMPPAPH